MDARFSCGGALQGIAERDFGVDLRDTPRDAVDDAEQGLGPPLDVDHTVRVVDHGERPSEDSAMQDAGRNGNGAHALGQGGIHCQSRGDNLQPRGRSASLLKRRSFNTAGFTPSE